MTSDQRGNGGDEPTVNFDYIKSPHFRIVRADGAIGAITPEGYIHFALYSERPAIPRQIIYRLNPDATLGDEIEERRVSRGGFVREMDVDVFVTVEVAQRLCRWLQEQIEKMHAREARRDAQQTKES